MTEEYITRIACPDMVCNSYEVVFIFPRPPFSKSLYESQLYTRGLVDSETPTQLKEYVDSISIVLMLMFMFMLIAVVCCL